MLSMFQGDTSDFNIHFCGIMKIQLVLNYIQTRKYLGLQSICNTSCSQVDHITLFRVISFSVTETPDKPSDNQSMIRIHTSNSIV